MTELEEKAGRAWALMFSHAMPAGIALDFVQELTDDRTRALEALRTRAVVAIANARPRFPSGSFCDVEAGAIGCELLGTRFDKAGHLLDALRHRLFQVEFISASPNGFVSKWLDWCNEAVHTLHLCRDLEAAK